MASAKSKQDVLIDELLQDCADPDSHMRAITEIESNYEALEIDFLAFFPDLTVFVETRRALASKL